MSYSLDPSRYPPEFAELFEKAQSESFEIETESYQQAMSLRHQLHAFRRAQEHVKSPGFSKLRWIEISVDKTTVRFSSKNKMLSSIKSVLGKSSAPPSDQEIEEYLKKMEGERDD